MSHKHSVSFHVAWVLTLAFVLLLLDLVFCNTLAEIFEEGYGVERITVIMLFLAVVAYVLTRPLAQCLRQWQIPTALFLAALREMDFDKRFTEQGLLKLRYFTDSGPWLDKLPGVLLVLVLLWMFYRLARQNLLPLLRDLWTHHVGAWMVAVGGAALVLAKSIDGIDRKLAPFQIHVDPTLVMRLARVEESLEMVFSMLMLLAVVIYQSSEEKNHRLSSTSGQGTSGPASQDLEAKQSA